MNVLHTVHEKLQDNLQAEKAAVVVQSVEGCSQGLAGFAGHVDQPQTGAAAGSGLARLAHLGFPQGLEPGLVESGQMVDALQQRLAVRDVDHIAGIDDVVILFTGNGNRAAGLRI